MQYKWVVLSNTTLGTFMASIDITIVEIALLGLIERPALFTCSSRSTGWGSTVIIHVNPDSADGRHIRGFSGLQPNGDGTEPASAEPYELIEPAGGRGAHRKSLVPNSDR